MSLIVDICITLISVSCAIYCGVKVNFIKNNIESYGDQNVKMKKASGTNINTGNEYNYGDRSGE